jgi:hypothetical protein
MKLYMAGAIIALAVVSLPASAGAVTFRDPQGVFTVDLPRAPTVVNDSTVAKSGDKISLIEYTIDDGSAALNVMISDYSGTNLVISLDNAVNGMVGGGRTLRSNKTVQLDGHEGRYAILMDQQGNQFADQVYVLGRRLYQALSALPKNATDAQRQEVARFNNTFHFTQ